jgi:heme-degrading monooxygenase HmoA
MMTTSQLGDSVYKVDRFTVPAAAMIAFTARLEQISHTLADQPGCLQSLILVEQGAIGGNQEVVTVVHWESEATFAAARVKLQMRYAAEGFNPPTFMRELGVNASMGVFRELEAHR